MIQPRDQYEDKSMSSLISVQSAMGEAVARKAMSEVQAAVIMAKKFPRDIMRAQVQACKEFENFQLAQTAIYSFPRGTGTVTGASIKMITVIARHFSNLKPGWSEVERLDDRSLCEAFCWDFESNTPYSVTFWVMHTRDKKGGAPQPITDERDIYEKIANYATRRMRSQIERHIPQYLVDAVKLQAQNTIAAGDGKAPWPERLVNMLAAFEKIHVTQAMLEKRLGHPWKDVSRPEFVELFGIYNALQDGQTSREDYFEYSTKGEDDAVETTRVTEQYNDAAEAKRQETIKQIEAVLDSRQKGGADVIDLENQMGMARSQLQGEKNQAKLMAVLNVLKSKPKPA